MVPSATVSSGPTARSVAVALAGTLLIASTYGLARFGVGLFAPRLVDERPALAPVVGWAAAAQFVSYAVAAAVAARVSDRRPRAAVLVAGTTAALGCLGVATTASPAWFVVLVLVGGAGAGLASPALVRLVDAVTPPRSAATAQALVNTGTAVGVVVAGVLALAVPSTAAAWWSMAAINALAAAGVLFLAREPDRPATVDADGRGTSYDWKLLVTPAVAAAVVGAGSALVWSYGPLVATGSGPVADGRVGFLWIALGLGGLAGPLTGGLVERRGLAGAWSWSGGAVALASLSLAAAVGLGLAWPAYVAMAWFGAGYMCLSGVLILWARDVWPEAAGRGTSVLFVALAVGQAVGALGFDAWLDVAGAVVACLTAALLCGAGAWVVRRR
ncbi:MFS transporter [Nocardioides sp. zg-1230]|uniref:MFS transporter n=1 Tax=Nocardioides sp. zg-1230 TaxID=2736601 RepID=UPI0015527B6D|nr:MFS transporter [Nocardioides sp. zg-1230]NPC42143.1 MFS transporter [Nocardioides sp. zg-1230]